MAKDLTAKLKLDHSQARRAAKQVKGDLQGVGKSGTGAMKGIGSQAMKLAGVLGVAGGLYGAITGLIRLSQALHDQWVAINAQMAESHRAEGQRMLGAAGVLQAPGVRALADIRGTTAREAMVSTLKQATEYRVSREAAEEASFLIESALQPGDVGGAANLRQIEADALRTAFVTGASGQTVGGLVITAREAYGAKTPEEFQQFLGKSRAQAKESKISLEEFGRILNETMPEAVKRGIDPDMFGAIVASMSFRLGEPRLIRTAVRQMMRATTRGSAEMERAAKAMGQSLDKMSPVQIMDMQARLLEEAAAQGPLAMGRAIEALGLPEEMAGVMLSTQDQASLARRGRLQALGQQATFGDIQEAFTRKSKLPESRLLAAETLSQVGQFQFGEEGSRLQSQRQLEAMQDIASAQPGFQEARLAFRTKELGEQGLDKPPSNAQLNKLFGLNKVWRAVRAALARVADAATDEGTRGAAAWHLETIDQAQSDANNWHAHWIFGGWSQAEYIDPFENAIRDAIQFLNRVRMGKPFEAEVTGQVKVPGYEGTRTVVDMETIRPGRAAAGAVGSVEEFVAGAAGGMTVNAATIYVTTPSEVSKNKADRFAGN